MCGSVAEQFLAFMSEKTASDRDRMIAFLKYELAGDETGPPLAVFRPMLAAVSRNVVLRNTVYDGANSRPHARTSAHRTGLMRGVEDEVRQVPAIAA
jgi:hypothetical protein